MKIINIKIDETYNLFKKRIEQFLILIKNNVPKDNLNNESTNNLNLIDTKFNNIISNLKNFFNSLFKSKKCYEYFK